MRCGTVFKDDPASEDELVYQDLERIACQLEWRAKMIRVAITHSRHKQSLEGLTEMVAYAFNAQQHSPSFGGGADQLPPGDYTVVAVASGQQESNSKQGGFMFFELTPTEGPLQGRKQIIRFNLHNTNPKTVEIANEQLTAFCHAIGALQGFQNTDELHMRPLRIRVDWQKGQEPSQEKPQGGYTEVKALFNMQGQEIGKGNGPVATTQQPQQPVQMPAGVQPQGQGWGGAPAGGQPQGGQPQGGFQQPQGQQPQQFGQQGGQPQGQQGGGQQGWGGAPQGGQPQGGQPQVDNNVAPAGFQPQGGQAPQGGQQGGAPGGWGGAPQGGQAPGGWGQT